MASQTKHVSFCWDENGRYDPSTVFCLCWVFLIHSISMVLPYPMPHFIIDRASSPILLTFVNVSLVIAWLLPITAPIIAMVFVIAYINSLIVGLVGWWNKLALETRP